MKKLIAYAAILLALALPARAQLVANIPLTGMLGISQGGTGASTAAGALANLGAAANNASTSVNGVACALGSSCTIPTGSTATIPNVVWADQTGAHHDGVTDDSGVINTDLASFGTAGGTVCLTPGETYAIASTVVIGNGSTTAVSTINGVHLEGCGGGAPGDIAQANAPTLKWTGPAGGAMLAINGPGNGFGIRDVNFNGNGLAANAVYNAGGANSIFSDIYITGWTGVAWTNTVQCPNPAGGLGAGWDTYRGIQAIAPSGTGADGLDLEGCDGSNADATTSTYTNMLWGYSGGTGTFGIRLGFADGNTFTDVGTIPDGGTLGLGGHDIVFVQQASPLQAFPYNNVFNQFGFGNGASGTSGTGGNFFPAYSLAGAPSFPYVANLSGYNLAGQFVFPGHGAGVSCGPYTPSGTTEFYMGIAVQC